MRGDHDVNQSLYPCGVHIQGDSIRAVEVITGTVHATEAIAGPVGTPERDAQWHRLEKLAHAVNAYQRSIPSRAVEVHIPLDQAAKNTQALQSSTAVLATIHGGGNA